MLCSFFRVGAVVCLLAGYGFAQQALPVDKLVEFIKSSIQQHMQDKEVAGFLKSVRLTQRLDARTIEELQGQGAGPKTVAELNRLAEVSATLTAAPPPPPPKKVSDGGPPPSYEEQQEILQEVREYALNYSQSLPNFICLEVTRRYIDRNYKAADPSWGTYDRIISKLTYFDQQEKYDLISRNDTSLYGKDYEGVGGTISRGEFGTQLKEIFSPESDTDFHWLRWGNLDGHKCHVYEYRVDQPHSKLTIDYNRQQQVTPSYHGLIYVDQGNLAILRITVEPNMPADFPLQDIKDVVDYKNVDVGGHQFLLPEFATVFMRDGKLGSKNEKEFRSYKKYAVDATITFDDVGDEPATQAPKEEGPPKQ
jgi:hypothetical protein